MRLKYIFIILFISILVSNVSAYSYYTIPINALTNSPADSVNNYMGDRLNGPNTGTPGMNVVRIPTSGVIERIEIYEYSGTAGSNQEYAYFIRINNQTPEYLIKSLSVATNERIFTNSSINIQVTEGDYFEINRTHPAWGTNPATNIVGGYVFINSTTNGYVIPCAHLTNSPGDGALNYFGFRPIVPSTTAYTNKLYIPIDGNITKSYLTENNTVNGTAEDITYMLMKNGGNDINIGTLAFNLSPQRLYNKTSLYYKVTRGDFIEWKRINPTWVVNPLANTVSGSVFVDTSVSRDVAGYPLFVQHLTASTTDAQTVYWGNLPKAPVTSAAISKVYIPKSGTIDKVEIYTYSGTAGTAEQWPVYIRVNNANDYLISKLNISANERLFKNNSMGITVSAGDYFEIKGVQPTWATNPATVISGGYVWISYGTASAGGDIILPPVSNFSANITSTLIGKTIKFFDQSNNTIPGTTTYSWNFVDGGTYVNSTDENPTFIYASPGTYTINHTINNGGVVSKSTGIITITGGGTPSGPPNSSFSIILTDTSTNYPTSWKWNATNLLGNNTEVTFSTSQNPIMNFGTGNWKINFTSTNAIGSNTTSQIIGWNLSSPRVYFWNRTA